MRWTYRLLRLGLGVMAAAVSGRASELLIMPTGARAVALGEASTVSVDDADALFWNPAALSRLPPYSVALGRTPALESVHDQFALAHNTGAPGAIALGMTSLSLGSVETTDRSGFPVGTASPSDWQVSGGAARGFASLGGISVGLSGKYISSTLVHTARAFAVDMGVLSPPYAGGRWTWGMALVNVGGRLRYDREGEPLPRMFRTGLSVKVQKNVTGLMEAHVHNDKTVSLASGVEHRRMVAKDLSLFLRAGFNGRQGQGTVSDGTNLGFGLLWKKLRVDYAYRGLTHDSPTQSVSLSYSFKPGRTLSPELQALVDEGNRLLETGQYPEAVLVFDEALRLDPTCREARSGMEKSMKYLSGR